MKKTRIFVLAMAMVLLIAWSALADHTALASEPALSSQPSGQIYLYGEQHGVEKILDKELELWGECYGNKNMHHLFVELPYYTAEFLNIWMKSDNDGILDEIYAEWIGTASHAPCVKEFYKKIKSLYPETVFHGTDVGHQYDTTGERFLSYLEKSGMKSTEQYRLGQEAIEQGKFYYANSDDVYRENKMAENFVREFDLLSGESVMGIYGGAHTGLDDLDYTTNSVPCMANQLKENYGNNIFSEDLSWLAKDIDAVRVDTISVNGKRYDASYFGKQDLNGFQNYAYREFWRLENAYNDFKDKPKTGDVLPDNNYPMLIEKGQVFVIDYAKKDGSVIRKYYRFDGYVWNGMPSTEEFTAE
jgi:hypothetical protein